MQTPRFSVLPTPAKNTINMAPRDKHNWMWNLDISLDRSCLVEYKEMGEMGGD